MEKKKKSKKKPETNKILKQENNDPLDLNNLSGEDRSEKIRLLYDPSETRGEGPSAK